MYATIIHTDMPESSVLINGVVAKEIARQKQEHAKELDRYQKILSAHHERSAQEYKKIVARKRKKNRVGEALLMVIAFPMAITMEINDKRKRFLKKFRKGRSRMILGFLNWALSHGLIMQED